MGILFLARDFLRVKARRYQSCIKLVHYAKLFSLLVYRLFHKNSTQKRLTKEELEHLLKSPICIFTTEICMYVARVYKYHLQKLGYEVFITTDAQAVQGEGFHILICAQFLKRLPKHYIVVQVEQLSASAWYGIHYFRIMEGADAVFDYNCANIEFLERQKLTAPVFFMPITVLPGENCPPNITNTKSFFMGSAEEYGDRMPLLA